jgi:hypothetical protein
MRDGEEVGIVGNPDTQRQDVQEFIRTISKGGD